MTVDVAGLAEILILSFSGAIFASLGFHWAIAAVLAILTNGLFKLPFIVYTTLKQEKRANIRNSL